MEYLGDVDESMDGTGEISASALGDLSGSASAVGDESRDYTSPHESILTFDALVDAPSPGAASSSPVTSSEHHHITMENSSACESTLHIDPLLEHANTTSPITCESVSNVEPLLDGAETTTLTIHTPSVVPATVNSGHDMQQSALLINNALSTSVPVPLPGSPSCSALGHQIASVQPLPNSNTSDLPLGMIPQPSTALGYNLKDNPKSAWITEACVYLCRLEVGSLWSQILELWLRLELGLHYPDRQVTCTCRSSSTCSNVFLVT
jgi:hypothetical protein